MPLPAEVTVDQWSPLLPEYPDLARGCKPLVPVGWYARPEVQNLVWLPIVGVEVRWRWIVGTQAPVFEIQSRTGTEDDSHNIAWGEWTTAAEFRETGTTDPLEPDI